MRTLRIATCQRRVVDDGVFMHDREGVTRRFSALTAVHPSALLLALALCACGETARRALPIEDALLDPYAGNRMRAVAEVGRSGDIAHVPVLIEMLDDDDPGVRLAAGSTLRELTGHDTGYEPWAEPAALRAQVLTWRAWWQQREVRARGPRDGPPPEPSR
jgi:HEAT repeat protein